MTHTDLALLGRTAVHLRPSQVAHRARLRGQQAGLRHFPEAGRRILSGPGPSATVGWPDAFRPMDARTPGRWPELPELRAGKIRLLGLCANTRRSARLAAQPTRLGCGAFTCTTGIGHGGWPPTQTGWRHEHFSPGYGGPGRHQPDSAMAMPGTLTPPHCERGRGAPCTTTSQLAVTSNRTSSPGCAVHAGFLRRHLEYDVGGNHLIKGLKALTGLAAFFADERLMRLALRRMCQAADSAGPSRRRSLRACARLSLPSSCRPHRRGRPAVCHRTGRRPMRFPQPSTACGAGSAQCSPPMAKCRCSTTATPSSPSSSLLYGQARPRITH